MLKCMREEVAKRIARGTRAGMLDRSTIVHGRAVSRLVRVPPAHNTSVGYRKGTYR
jgi:hypothetical protein